MVLFGDAPSHIGAEFCVGPAHFQWNGPKTFEKRG